MAGRVGWAIFQSLQRRHNERNSVLNHRRLDCLLNCLFRYRSKKTWNFRVTGLCATHFYLKKDSKHFDLINWIWFILYHSKYNPISICLSKKHSTVTCLHRVIDDMCENIDDGLVCGVCFLDIEKCFDTIDHDIFLQKLKWYGIDGHELDWLKNYLYDRKQCVRVDNITPDVTPCPIGVPQASTLGPIFFPIICKWLCLIYWEPKLQHFCRRCYDLLFWKRYSRNRITVAMCVKLTPQIGSVLVHRNQLWC